MWDMCNDLSFDIVIIGSGVAGLSAGIFGGRANKSVLIIEDGNIGGTTATLKDIKNYPGFENIDGFSLVQNMYMQCAQFGANFEFGDISNIDFESNTIVMKNNNSNTICTRKSVETKTDNIIENNCIDDNCINIKYRTLIIASGMSSNKLNCEGEEKLKFKGVSYCAICDGNLYKDKNIIVFTNNFSASSAIDYLTNISSNIIVMDISSGYMSESLKVYHNVKPIKILGDKSVSSIDVKINDDIINFPCNAIFIELGKSSKLDLYKEKINTKDNQILSDENMKTNIENVFVAGDIRYKSLKQIVTACSDGAIASTQAIKYINNKK